MASKSRGWSFLGLFGAKVGSPKSAPPADPFHAVSIMPGTQACGSAHRFTGHRFLARLFRIDQVPGDPDAARAAYDRIATKLTTCGCR